MDCEEASQPNDVQGSSSLNESFDEQQVDLVRMETDAGEWMVVKKRNGKSRVGLNSPPKQHEVVNLIRKKEVDVFGLLESKLFASKVASMQKFQLKNWKFLSNAEMVGNIARVIVFWNPSFVSVASSAQGLHVSICSLVHQVSFRASFVYEFNTVVARCALWNDVRSWNSCTPWMILGDFNAIMSQAVISLRPMEGFGQRLIELW
ncbi:hypothetical protein OIU76_016347 [Salix suchowensis]|nr:hypothetical protein OIU76_016347 [Salix suchowensis]